MSERHGRDEVTTADAHRARARPVEVVAVRVHRRGEEPLVLSLAKRQRSTLLIGRGDGVECRLADENVSRIHGFLRGDDDTWVYVDVGSANGSYLMEGGQRVPLRPGVAQPLVVGTDIHLARDNRIEPLATWPRSRVSAGTRSVAGLEFEAHLQAAAPSTLPVFLLGPSGAGKTWAARTLHELGRPGRPFVALNCARLPTDPVQLQSTLIGHVKGAFTGAVNDHDGAFLAARGGTLFLDEVESLTPTAQGFLLDLLEESGQLRRLGSQTVVRPEVRIVSASKTELRRSALRHDLSHRLASGEIVRVPRLAERRDDIPDLVAGFIRARDGEAAVTVTSGAMQALRQAPWRGEVRELEGSVRLLADRARRLGGGVIDVEDVQRRLRDLDEAHGTDHARDFGEDDQTAHDLRRPATTLWARSVEGAAPLDRNPRRVTREDVIAALQATGGNIEHAARRLGVARNTLTKKMDDFGVQRPSRR